MAEDTVLKGTVQIEIDDSRVRSGIDKLAQIRPELRVIAGPLAGEAMTKSLRNLKTEAEKILSGGGGAAAADISRAIGEAVQSAQRLGKSFTAADKEIIASLQSVISKQQEKLRLQEKQTAEAEKQVKALQRLAEAERNVARESTAARRAANDPAGNLSVPQQIRVASSELRIAQTQIRTMTGNPFEVLSNISGQLTGVADVRNNLNTLGVSLTESSIRAQALRDRVNSITKAFSEIRAAGGQPTQAQQRTLQVISKAADLADEKVKDTLNRAKAASAQINTLGFRSRAVTDFFVSNVLTGSIFTVGFTAAQAINENLINGAVTFGRTLLDPIAVAKDRAAEIKDVLSSVGKDPERMAKAIGITLQQARGLAMAFSIQENIQLRTEFERRGGGSISPSAVLANDLKKIINVDAQRQAADDLQKAGNIFIAASTAFAAAVVASRLAGRAGGGGINIFGGFGGGGKSGGTAAAASGLVDRFGQPIASAPTNAPSLLGSILRPVSTAASAITGSTIAGKIAQPLTSAAKSLGPIAKLGRGNLIANVGLTAVGLATGQGLGESIIGLVGGIGGGLIGSMAGPGGTIAGSIAGSTILSTFGQFLDNIGQPSEEQTFDVSSVAARAAIIALSRASIVRAGVATGAAGLLSQSPAVQQFVGENQAAIMSGNPDVIAQLAQEAQNAIALQMIDTARTLEQVDFSRTKLTTEQVALLATILSKEEMISLQKRQQLIDTKASVESFRNLTSAQNEIIRLQNIGAVIGNAPVGGGGLGGFTPFNRLPETSFQGRGNVRIPQSVLNRNALLNTAIGAQENLSRLAGERMNIEFAARNEARRERNIQREERLQRLRDSIAIAGVRQAGMTSFDVAANIAEAQAQAKSEREAIAREAASDRRSARIEQIAIEEQKNQNTIAQVEAIIRAEDAQKEWADSLTKERIKFSEAFTDARRETEAIWSIVTDAGHVIERGMVGFATVMSQIINLPLVPVEGSAPPSPAPGGNGQRTPYLPYLTGEPTTFNMSPRSEALSRNSNQTIVLQAAPIYIDGKIVGESVERHVSIAQSRRGAYGVS